MLRFAFAMLAATTLSAALSASTSDESNVINKECPELLLEEEIVQGEPITWDSLQGKAVLFLFYQRECEGCERYAMPRIQKLHERYAGSRCWQVFVINTAFDKDIYPHLADISETRKHLKRMDWTMPVARDLDERSNELFTLDDQSGTPQAVVMDEFGIVRAHDWYSEKPEMDRIDAVFEGLCAAMNCHCVRMPREVRESCKGAREAFKEGNYADAYDKADTISNSYGYDEADKTDADYLKKFIDDTVRHRIERVTTHFGRDPEAALPRADQVMKDFAGLAPTKEFATVVENWRKSDELANFRTGKKDLEKLEAELAKAGEPAKVDDARRKDLVDRLTRIADRTGNTVVAENARRHLDRLTLGTGSGEGKNSNAGSSGGDATRVGSSGDTPRVGSSRGGDAPRIGSSGEAPKTASKKPVNTTTETSRHRRVREQR